MKNTLIAIALAATGALGVSAAHAADNHNGFFINGHVGQSNVDKGLYDDDDTAFGGNVGYRWAVSPNVLLGVEGGYVDLGKAAPNGGNPIGTSDIGSAEIDGWTVGVNGHFNLTDNWYLSGRAGLFRSDLKGSYFEGTTPVRVDGSSNDWYAGAGFGYDFSNNFSLGLNYDYYRTEKAGLKLDPGVLSVGAEYRF
ncbi:MAG: porin family protein [Lysobacteraceae bacterium]|nr:MAG: porin family protein [Xanthomonadaceae bacterium]